MDPKIPTLKDAQKPQVKIKGMGAGLTLFDRLKQFKKKDLAFILAGLGTLFMAPLAEHFMMAPENGDGTLEQGWGKGGAGSNLFGGGSSPYENGNNNIAQGGAIGGSGDIITPLNVRDPSALVMGPGQAQQPPAGSAAPAVAPPTAGARPETDYKDALAGAASRAASAAVKKSPVPVPKVALGGSGLRGLGVAGGGTSASGGLGAVGPAAGGAGGGGGNGINLVRNSPGFNRAAGPRSPTGSDGVKAAGQSAGDQFARHGNALSGLQAAAGEQIPSGGSGSSGGGQGGAGRDDKGPGGSGPGGGKNIGESLAFLEAKQRMEENLKLEFEKRRLKDPELLLYGMRNDALKAAGTKVSEEATKWGMCKIFGWGCPAPDDDFKCPGGTMNRSQMKMCAGGGKDKEEVKGDCFKEIAGAMQYFDSSDRPTYVCNPTGKPAAAGEDPKETETAASDALQGGVHAPSGARPGSLDALTLCKPAQEESAASNAEQKALFEKMREELPTARRRVSSVMLAHTVLSSPDQTAPKCGGAAPLSEVTHAGTPRSVKHQLLDMRTDIGGADGKGGAVKTLTDALASTDPKELAAATKKIEKIRTQYDETVRLLKATQDLLKSTPETIGLDSFGDRVSADRKKYADSYRQTKEFAGAIQTALENLEPAVIGLEASGVKLEDAPEGSTKLIVDVHAQFNAAVATAKKTTVKNEAGVDVPVLDETADVSLPEAKPGAEVQSTEKTIYRDGAQAAAKLAVDARTKVTDAEASLGGADDETKKKAKPILTGDVRSNIADARQKQIEMLEGIGRTSDASTAAPTPAVANR